MITLEKLILGFLSNDEQYARKVIPFLKAEYFQDKTERIIYQTIDAFFTEHNACPSKDIISIEVSNRKDLDESEHKEAQETITELKTNSSDADWLLKETEKFCKTKSIYNAILKSIQIMDGKDPKYKEDAIPSLLSEALGVSFDTAIGHDYLDDSEERFDFYHSTEEKISFNLDTFNQITNGGLSKKSLNCVLASTGVGKSMFMTHCSAHWIALGIDVLYITMEMAEERIAERIDANLMNINLDDLHQIDKKAYLTKIDNVKAKTKGKLVIKEFPTSSAHVGHFRALLDDLKIKRNFVPQVIVIDYVNICASQRLKAGANVNSYSYVKAIAEELRGLAVERDVPILTATQTNRDGANNTDIDVTNTSESFGLPQTVDMLFALIATEELADLNQVMVKQLKNRYTDVNKNKKFIIGVDRAKMKFYDVESSAQTNLSGANQTQGNSNSKYKAKKAEQNDDTPVFDKGKFGERLKAEKFGGFKF